ncbi:hypothetical protein HY413_02670 [Candidatus Kaiserbacteria bacterium]|nr:hypothetical protein [Candidatus Kaiserbacteria bacterium]
MHLLRHRTYRIFPLTLIFLAAFFSFTSLSHAESVQDTQVIPYTLSRDNGNSCTEFMAPGTVVTVSYTVSATNADTGAPVCGTSVPVGTPLKFEFQPHVPEDIVWSTSGYYAATPYGSWAINGNYSPWDSGNVNRCEAPNFYHTAINTHYGYLNEFAVLAIATPGQNVSTNGGGLTCDTPDRNGNVRCIAQQAGTEDVQFNIQSTSGYFYPGMIDMVPQPTTSGVCNSNSNNYLRMRRNGYEIYDLNTTITSSPCYGTGPYTVVVQPKTVSCPITIVDASTNGKPTAPSLASVGQCTVGTPHSITMQSTDPDGDNLKYGIDWDADGSVDQFVPPTGYVLSGAPQTATRTYSIAGTKTVKVMAQDSNGLSSSWASVSFSCADTAPSAGQCTDTLDNDGDGKIDSEDPDCAAPGGTNEFTFVPPASNPPPATPTADLHLSVPSLVGRGKTVQVVWSADNVNTCLPVTGTIGDSFPQLSLGTSFFSPIGGKTSSPITARTTYSLICVDLNGITRTKTATVNIQPNFRER